MSTSTTETDVAKHFSLMINSMGTNGFEFASAVVNDHRTLVQKSAAVFCTFFVLLAKDADSGFFDARDETAARLAQKIRDLLVAENVLIRDDEVRLPFI